MTRPQKLYAICCETRHDHLRLTVTLSPSSHRVDSILDLSATCSKWSMLAKRAKMNLSPRSGATPHTPLCHGVSSRPSAWKVKSCLPCHRQAFAPATVVATPLCASDGRSRCQPLVLQARPSYRANT